MQAQCQIEVRLALQPDNVRANLPDMTDPQDRERISRGSDEMLARGIALVQRVSPRIWKRA